LALPAERRKPLESLDYRTITPRFAKRNYRVAGAFAAVAQ